MAKYDTNRSLNPVQSDLSAKTKDAPRSAFNLSHMRYYKMKVGNIAPIAFIETLPNEDYTIQISNLVKLAIPMARQFFGSFRVYTHVYHQEYHCMWEGSDAHYTNGRSGLLDIKKPTLGTYLTEEGGSRALETSVLNSPLDYMALPFHRVKTSTDYLIDTNPSYGGSTIVNPPLSGQISALPFVMYHNICRDYYSPQNLVQNNKLLFPDNPNDMVLPYDSNGRSVRFMIRNSNSYNKTNINLSNPDFSYFHGVDNDYCDILLNVMKYRSWKGDYFTTSSPFANLLRGNVPTMELASVNTTLDFSDVFSNSDPSTNFKGMGVSEAVSSNNILFSADSAQARTIAQSVALSSFNRARVNSVLNASINLNQLRQLEAVTIFRERMARTSGEYNEMIDSQGLGNPKHEHNRPRYLGGSYQDLVFSDVTNLASGEGSQPLGTRTSQAMSSASGDVIRFHSKDYGALMVCVSVVPDTVYSQGVDRVWTKLSNSEEYFPILNNLSPQPVLNKEIYFQNNSDDDGLFGYQERFSEYKSMRDKVSGAFALPSFEGRKSVSQRRFTSLPTLSPSFMSLSNFDYSIFSNSLEMPFDFVTALSIRKISPMPYTTIPGGLQARG